MIGWLARRTEQAGRERAGRVLAALEDGHAHYLVGDLDRRTRIHAATLHAVLAGLVTSGLVESGSADLGNGRRRWYRLKEKT